ncbi:MAG: hypothetical protein WDN30_07670 [Pararobbsia sp.]
MSGHVRKIDQQVQDKRRRVVTELCKCGVRADRLQRLQKLLCLCRRYLVRRGLSSAFFVTLALPVAFAREAAVVRRASALSVPCRRISSIASVDEMVSLRTSWWISAGAVASSRKSAHRLIRDPEALAYRGPADIQLLQVDDCRRQVERREPFRCRC